MIQTHSEPHDSALVYCMMLDVNTKRTKNCKESSLRLRDTAFIAENGIVTRMPYLDSSVLKRFVILSIRSGR